MNNSSGPGNTKVGANEEDRQLQDTVKDLAEEKEKFSSNIDKVSTAKRRLQDHKKMLKNCIDDQAGRVATLTNELAQEKSEIDIKNSRLTALE